MRRLAMSCLFICAMVVLMAGPLADAWASCGGCGKGAKTEKNCDKKCAVCVMCGELKCSEKCCKAEGRAKCEKCGLFKDSVACCRLPEGMKADKANLCLKCGEFADTEKCCKAEGRERCKKCGLFRGSPGCCNVPKECLGKGGTKEEGCGAKRSSCSDQEESAPRKGCCAILEVTKEEDHAR